MQNQDVVVLIHGLGGSRIDMWPISRRLQQCGFRTKNWGYRSVGNGIESHAARLCGDLRAIDRQLTGGRLHIVTHSMGGIIARAAFEQSRSQHLRFSNLGRVVMLAPPNRGSHTARKLSPFLGWLTPSLAQLSDAPESFVNQLANPLEQSGIEFGIVEAEKDRVVASESVRLSGCRDFASVDGHHGILTWYSETWQLVEHFLRHGQFTVAQSQTRPGLISNSGDRLNLEGRA